MKGDNELNIQLSEEMHKELQSIANDLGFTSTQEFVHYILRDVLDAVRNKDVPAGTKIISEQEQKEMKTKLQDLGYI